MLLMKESVLSFEETTPQPWFQIACTYKHSCKMYPLNISFDNFSI